MTLSKLSTVKFDTKHKGPMNCLSLRLGCIINYLQKMQKKWTLCTEKMHKYDCIFHTPSLNLWTRVTFFVILKNKNQLIKVIPSIIQNKVSAFRIRSKASPLSPFFVHTFICASMHCMRWLEREVTLFQGGWSYSVLWVVAIVYQKCDHTGSRQKVWILPILSIIHIVMF